MTLILALWAVSIWFGLSVLFAVVFAKAINIRDRKEGPKCSN